MAAAASDASAASTFPRLPFACGLFGVLAGGSTILGWLLHIPRLVDWAGSGLTMKFNAAACTLLCGGALLLLVVAGRQRLAARAMAGVVFSFGLLTLLQHVTGANFGIDNFVVWDRFDMRGTASPGRMGIPGSTSFMLLGVALFLAQSQGSIRRIAAALGLVVVSFGLFSLVGYLYGASTLYTLPQLTGIAFQTVVVQIALGLGTAAAIPEYGLFSALRRQDAGGVLLRRIVVPAVLIPIVLGWIRIQGQRAGLYDFAFGAAVYAVTTVLSIVALVVWCASDISRLATAERASREALEEANAELERRVEARTADLVAKMGELEGFSYSVSHDMRAPLRAIVGNAQIVLEDDGEKLDEDGKARLVSLAAAAKKMALLVDDLLTYARLGQTRPKNQACDLSDLARRTADEVLHDHGDLDASVEVEPGLRGECDPRLIGLVLHNLVDNALKYRVRGRPVRVQVGQTPDGAIFVRDNGIGFEMKYAERIFKAFERLHRDEEYLGTGIGLANVQRIVERHGGRVWAEGRPDEGATFFFTLG